jgi:hypothetical protein
MRSASTLTNDHCEIWINKGWRIVRVTYAIARPSALVRCAECKGRIRLHRPGPNGVPRAHMEHLVGHPGCSVGKYFDGTHTPHPDAVANPSSTAAAALVVAIEDDESSHPEGVESYRMHRTLERDGSLPRRVKRMRLQATGRLECDVCTFDFFAFYGALGIGFIEAHHKLPVSRLTGREKTKAAHLALVCSNCHRMLHRSDPELTVEQLKATLKVRDAA